jgi:hypothetical protein
MDAVIVFTPRHEAVACSYAGAKSGNGVPAPVGSNGGLGAQPAAAPREAASRILVANCKL